MAVCGLSSMEAVQLVQPRTQHRSLCPFLSQIEAWSPFPSLYYIQNFSNQKHKTGHGSGHEVSINSKWNAIIICNIQKKKKKCSKTSFPSRAILCVPVKKRLIYNPVMLMYVSVWQSYFHSSTQVFLKFSCRCCQFILKHWGGFEGHAFKHLKYISTTRQAGVNEN